MACDLELPLPRRSCRRTGRPGVRYQPGVLPVFPGCEPLTGLAVQESAKRLDRHCGEGEGAAGPFGLGLAVHADRSPHGHVRRDGRAGGRVAVQVDMGPVQGPGFFGTDPGQQARRDVGVHQRGRAADVLQAGPQFHDGKGAGGRDDRHHLVQGQGLGRPAFLALGRVGQGGDVAADQATSGQCRVPVSYMRVWMTCSRLGPGWPSASPVSRRHSRGCSCGPAGGAAACPRAGLRAAGHQSYRHLRDVRYGRHRCASIAPGGT